jgi:hypothetical protein
LPIRLLATGTDASVVSNRSNRFDCCLPGSGIQLLVSQAVNSFTLLSDFQCFPKPSDFWWYNILDTNIASNRSTIGPHRLLSAEPIACQSAIGTTDCWLVRTDSIRLLDCNRHTDSSDSIVHHPGVDTVHIAAQSELIRPIPSHPPHPRSDTSPPHLCHSDCHGHPALPRYEGCSHQRMQ